MNRKILALILALVVGAAAIVLAVTLSKDTPGTNASDSTSGVENNESTPDMPGEEDSGFASESVDTTEPMETTTPGTEHGNTIPTGPADPDDGLQDPDVDVPEDTRPVQTDPAVTEPQQTKPTQPAETEPVHIPDGEIDYETFVGLDPAVQRQYMESFESIDAFFEWYNAAKETYDQEHPAIDVGDGVIDLEDLVG